MNPEILVPITFLIIVMILIKSVLNYRHKRLVLWHQTMREAMGNDSQISPDLINRITKAVDPQRSDLKKALLFLGLAAMLGIAGFAIPFQDAQGSIAFRVVACIPLGFSIMYLGFWKFLYK